MKNKDPGELLARVFLAGVSGFELRITRAKSLFLSVPTAPCLSHP